MGCSSSVAVLTTCPALRLKSEPGEEQPADEEKAEAPSQEPVELQEAAAAPAACEKADDVEPDDVHEVSNQVSFPCVPQGYNV
jgi:hypothetical protein